MKRRKVYALPRGITLTAGRFFVSVTWQGSKIHLGRFVSLEDAVEARVMAERERDWHGAREDRGKTLEQRQREAVAAFQASGGAELARRSEERNRALTRVRDRLKRGWCQTCAQEVPAGGRKRCSATTCQTRRRQEGAQKGRTRAETGRTGAAESVGR